jgi:hypothetical protein
MNISEMHTKIIKIFNCQSYLGQLHHYYFYQNGFSTAADYFLIYKVSDKYFNYKGKNYSVEEFMRVLKLLAFE